MFGSRHVSILDFFVPGSTTMIATIEQVLPVNSYAQALFICMLLLFPGKHVCRYLWGLAETQFGSSLPSGLLNSV
jgi:hypothetical protein